MFHNKKLEAIHEESKQIISDYQKELDKLSEDIKCLEKILQNSGVGEFMFEFSRGKNLGFSEGRLKYIDMNENIINHNPRPLIEHKAIIRMEVAAYLPEFFELCMNKIKSGVKNVSSV
jgi:hypothetical protein